MPGILISISHRHKRTQVRIIHMTISKRVTIHFMNDKSPRPRLASITLSHNEYISVYIILFDQTLPMVWSYCNSNNKSLMKIGRLIGFEADAPDLLNRICIISCNEHVRNNINHLLIVSFWLPILLSFELMVVSFPVNLFSLHFLLVRIGSAQLS